MQNFNIKLLDELEEKTNKNITINLIQADTWKLISYSNAKDSAWSKTFDENDKFKREKINFELLQQEASI